MQETDYQYQIPAVDYTKNHLYSRVTKATNRYDFWFKKNFNFMHLQFIFIKHNKLEFLNLPTSNGLFDQILSYKKLYHCSYKNMYTHRTLHINKVDVFVNNEFSSPFSPCANYSLEYFYLHGSIRNNDAVKEYFIYYSQTNLNQPLTVRREVFLTQDPHVFVYHNQALYPLTAQTHSLFHPHISQPIPQQHFTFIIIH